jgi:hypothetical protein
MTLSAIVLSALLPAVLGTAGEDPPPLYCRANALDKAQRRRQQELLALMRRSAQATEELRDGYALRLPAEAGLFQQAAEWIALERRCCPFVDFALEWKADESVRVRLTGGKGVKAFLAAEVLEADRRP